MKIAIVGGTFDPIHKGHLAIGKYALEHMGMDEVWFMPAGKTPLKDRKLTKKKDRLAMCNLAIKGEDKFRICPIELERKGKSYTIDTVKQLKELFPNQEFTWIIGADQLEQFDEWKDADKLVELIDFACVDRPGITAKSKFGIPVYDMEPVDISSSEIRKGNKLEYLQPDVLKYIYDHHLYVDGFVASRMTEYRYHHSLSVAALCQAFAQANGYDPQKAFLTGLFHDIAKCMPVKEQQQWMKQVAPEHLGDPIPTWHGYVGAEVAKQHFLIDDPEIYDAIWNHVHGSSRKPYAMMVFAADKLDPLRGYDSSALIEACMENLENGFNQTYEENHHYLKDKEII